jgi:hypothetical protein
MIQNQFQAAAFNSLEKADENEYTNARYADGTPFPLFKQSGAYFTDWTPSSQSASNTKKRMNLPTNNTLFRNTQSSDGVRLQNNENAAWVFRTQTLANNGDVMACRNNTDCASWPGTSCNPNHQSWTDAKGNQGNYCSKTHYPELDSGIYVRKDSSQGGIGKSCTTDTDCSQGYSCNNETNMFGKNVQQTGYCSQTYDCDTETQYLGYPYNSGIPIPPPKDQNNYGKGYSTKEMCNNIKLSQQDCVKDNSGKWFATYPGYCPVPTNLRKGDNPLGALPTSSMRTVDKGITIPSYATNASSNIGKPQGAFSAWNMNSSKSSGNDNSGMSEPMQYELSINPRN